MIGSEEELEQVLEDNSETFEKEAEDGGEMPSQEESEDNKNMFVTCDQIATDMWRDYELYLGHNR